VRAAHSDLIAPRAVASAYLPSSSCMTSVPREGEAQSATVIVANLLADILCTYLDPRVRAG
jgi:hypothetical protein